MLVASSPPLHMLADLDTLYALSVLIHLAPLDFRLLADGARQRKRWPLSFLGLGCSSLRRYEARCLSHLRPPVGK